ncbi:MAG: phosphatidylglycerophosphatase A [bacterium]|nr:phosphatidylglycerophosphatase A [bacterium]
MNTAVCSKLKLWIATGFGLGYLPFVPGTVGSLGGVVLFWLFHPLTWYLYLLFIASLFFLGIWAADWAEVVFQEKDSNYIVIDEIVGFLIAAFLIPWSGLWMIAAFILFRIFDIIKPFPAGRAERLRGGLGIMLDDVGAGIYANLVLQGMRVWLCGPRI